MDDHELKQQLSVFAADSKIIISSTIQQQLIDFLYFLQKWNKAYNLTGITHIEKMLTHHLLDSLAIGTYLRGQNLLDVGTGAGFPGIPLALIYPQRKVTLLDSNGKKICFLQQAKQEFNLHNVEVIQARVELFQPEHCFDDILARAVGTLKQIVHSSQHLICTTGQWLCMKGRYPEQELKDISWPVENVALSVPHLQEERHLIIIKAKDVIE